jgi:hypothetical protein
MRAELDRFTLDRIARAVVSGRRGLGPQPDRLADRVAALMQNRLAAVGAPGAGQATSIARRGRFAMQPPIVRRLIDRTAKHLGLMAMGGARRAPAHGR